MSKVAELIRGMRQNDGLSQSEIARQTGIPQPRLSRWESGDVAAGADDALKLMELAARLKKRRPRATPTPTPQEQPHG